MVGTLSKTLGQLAPYTYCNNNPISYTDESGEGIITILVLLGIGTLIGGVFGGVSSYLNWGTGWEIVKDSIIGAAFGLAGTGLMVISGGAAVSAVLQYTTVFYGVPIAQAFAIGALFYNCTMLVLGSLLGFEAILLEMGQSQDVPEPYVTPKHPGERKKRTYRSKFNMINWRLK